MANVSNSVKSLRNLTRSTLGLEDWIHTRTALSKSDDRSCVIISTAMFEEVIEIAILARFVPKASNLNSDMYIGLFGTNGTLTTFSAKIKIAEALGIIGPITRGDLDVIREIRNAFAHAQHSIGFSSDVVANVCKLIKMPDEIHYDNSRLRFVDAVDHIWTELTPVPRLELPAPHLP
jgi:DNA-binding MltR family transcriptional regulator